jgi:predicted DNA-binding transcriptional regulator YafY
VSAAQQFTRIVSLVAELTRLAREGGAPTPLAELAERHGVSEKAIANDIATLTALGEHADSDWLLSLSVALQLDLVSISSGGPFRRPVRLSPEEQVAIRVALALQPDGAPLAARLAAFWSGRPGPAAPAAGETKAPGDIIRRAAASAVEVTMQYASEGEHEGRERRIEPHQVVEFRGRAYVVGYDVGANGWRHFRLDRVLRATATGREFERRADFVPVEEPEDVFRTSDPLDVVTVRFAVHAAHWVTEHYPEHEVEEDGSVLVRLHTASPEWLTRTVLEHGGDAEVIDPPEYREAVKAAVA